MQFACKKEAGSHLQVHGDDDAAVGHDALLEEVERFPVLRVRLQAAATAEDDAQQDGDLHRCAAQPAADGQEVEVGVDLACARGGSEECVWRFDWLLGVNSPCTPFGATLSFLTSVNGKQFDVRCEGAASLDCTLWAPHVMTLLQQCFPFQFSE